MDEGTRDQGDPERITEEEAHERALRALEPGARIVHGRWDFDNPAHEWRRLFSELLGTFFLVLVGAGGAVVNAQSDGAISRAAAVTAPGLMVMAIILFMGAVSGAHLNPAVSIAFAARGDFPGGACPATSSSSSRAPPSPASCSGRSSASSACWGRPSPAPGSRDVEAMLMELVLTVGLVSVILGTASGAQNVGRLRRPRRRRATSSSPASGRARSAAPR